MLFRADRIKQQLTEYELVSEEWGGDTIVCPISAKTGMGIDALLENVVLLAEMQELKANPNRAAKGAVIEARLDLVLGNDITTPVAITEFEKAGFTQVFDRDHIAIVLDHYTPCKDIKSAQLCKQARAFAKKHQITHFYDVGQVGVEHALIPEKGLAAPGELIIGADSHTCTYGEIGRAHV